MTTAGVITNIGLTAMLAAQIADTTFSFASAQISSSVLSPTGDETVLPSVVYTVPSANITQVTINENTIRTIVYLDTTIGTFTIGTIGLFAGSTLFALAAFPSAGSKVANSLPGVVGNIRTFYIDTVYDSITSIVGSLGSISSLTLQEMLAGIGGIVTARQLRTALSNMSLLSAAYAAISTQSATSQARIDWETCAATVLGDPLMIVLAPALGQTDGGAAILAAAALLPA